MGQLHDRNCRRAFAPAEAFQADTLPADRFQSEVQVGRVGAGRACRGCPGCADFAATAWDRQRRTGIIKNYALVESRALSR